MRLFRKVQTKLKKSENMKSIVLKSIMYLSLFLLISCRKGPGDTIVAMNKDICASKSLTPMLKYTAPESKEAMKLGIQFMTEGSKKGKLKKLIDKGCNEEGWDNIYKEEIDGDIALVYTTIDDTQPFKLKKIDGKWLLYITKD